MQSAYMAEEALEFATQLWRRDLSRIADAP